MIALRPIGLASARVRSAVITSPIDKIFIVAIKNELDLLWQPFGQLEGKMEKENGVAAVVGED